MGASLFGMSKMISKEFMKKKILLILAVAALVIPALLTSGCTCGCPATEWWPCVISDHTGGALVTYGIHESGDRNAYIQRVDTGGNKLWGGKGVLLSSASPPDGLGWPQMVADGSGGAVAVWSQDGVIAQKVDSEGHTVWRMENVPIHSRAHVIGDGSGGAIIASSSYLERKSEYLLQILRLNSEGDLLWAENDAPISLGLLVGRFEMVSDNSGGAIIVWKKRPADIFIQRIDSEGNVLWKQGGLEISTPGSYNPAVTGDGSGGAIVVWEHPERTEEGQQLLSIYTQRVDATGNILWPQGGLPICSSSELPISDPRIVRDGSGGAIISFLKRSGNTVTGLCYAQRLDATGRNQWQPDGTLVSTKQGLPFISADGFGGVIIVCWPYVQKINAQGERMWGEKGIMLSRKDIF